MFALDFFYLHLFIALWNPYIAIGTSSGELSIRNFNAESSVDSWGGSAAKMERYTKAIAVHLLRE